jgi:hypothetical protein
LVAPVPTAIIVITAATPMMMPSIVSRLRSLLAASARSAERMAARKVMPAPSRRCPPPPAHPEHDPAARPRGDVALVRDQHDRHALAIQLGEQPHDLFAGVRVERPGRLVGQDHLRLVHERAGDGHPLLLAAGEFRRRVLDALAEAHALQRLQRARAALRGARAGIHHRQFHVLQRAGARAAG